MTSLVPVFLGLFLVTCRASLEARSPQRLDCSGNKTDPHNIGGERALAEEFPWLVLLEVTYTNSTTNETISSICAGVLIEWDLVLTAANCLELDSSTTVRSVEDIIVYANATDRCSMTGKKNQCVTAKAFCKHEKFNSETGVADIAVIRLNENLGSTINLPNNLNSSTDATIVGWGETLNGPKVSGLGSRYLMKTTVEIRNSSLCDVVSPSHILVRATGRDKDVGRGDNWGPMIRTQGSGIKTVHGIMTNYFRNDNCGQGNRLYTSVSHYHNWVKENFACGTNRGCPFCVAYSFLVFAPVVHILMNLLK